MEETLRAALRKACAVTGSMAGALVRRKIRGGDLKRWREGLEEAASVLVTEEETRRKEGAGDT